MTEHEEKYERLAQFVEVDDLRRLVSRFGIAPERWAELLAADEHLNNVPLSMWDARDGAFIVVYATPRGVLGVLAVAGSRLTALASALTFALALGANISKGGF